MRLAHTTRYITEPDAFRKRVAVTYMPTSDVIWSARLSARAPAGTGRPLSSRRATEPLSAGRAIGNRNESYSQKPVPGGSASTVSRPRTGAAPTRHSANTRLGPISSFRRGENAWERGGLRAAATPRATRVAPKVDKYRRSAALTGAPVECGVRRSTPGGPAELQKAPARGMAPAMAIPGDQFQPFAVLRFAPVAFRFASRGICAGHRRATTSATTSATTPDVPLSRAVPQSARCRLLAAAGPAPPDVIGRSAPVPLCLVRRLLGS